MAVFRSGPDNIEQNNSAAFVVEFFDANGFLAVPPSASMTVTYVNTSYATQTDTLVLVNKGALSGSVFTGTWSSTSASLCLATWVVLAGGSSIQQATGQIRVIERRGG